MSEWLLSLVGRLSRKWKESPMPRTNRLPSTPESRELAEVLRSCDQSIWGIDDDPMEHVAKQLLAAGYRRVVNDGCGAEHSPATNAACVHAPAEGVSCQTRGDGA